MDRNPIANGVDVPLPIRDASNEDLLNMEIDASLFDFDEEEDAMIGKLCSPL